MKHDINDYDFNLPDDLIARYPLKKRDDCRLLYCNKRDRTRENNSFKNISDYISSGDILVINNTHVEKSRFFVKRYTGTKYEILLIEKRKDSAYWLCKIKRRRKLKIDEKLFINSKMFITLKEKFKNDLNLVEIFPEVFEEIQKIAELPLPGYIRDHRDYTKEDDIYYQTVFYEHQEEGSKAAPTAGLHFSLELLEKLKKKGVIIVPIQLFISLGTFNPIQTESILEHKMHEENYEVSIHSATILNEALRKNQKIIAVGTTSLRALESSFWDNQFHSGRRNTSIFIKPGYQVKTINALITNFHTPKSTLVVLVSVLMGYNFFKESYKDAISEEYRFFSYGDAMFIDNTKEINETL